MLLLLLIYVVLRALWKIDVYLISTLVNKSLYYHYSRQSRYHFRLYHYTTDIQVKNEIHLPNNLNKLYIFFHLNVYAINFQPVSRL